MEIKQEEHNKIIIGNGKTGFITSQTVEANLLFAVLEKLEKIRCCIIDVEKAMYGKHIKKKKNENEDDEWHRATTTIASRIKKEKKDKDENDGKNTNNAKSKNA